VRIVCDHDVKRTSTSRCDTDNALVAINTFGSRRVRRGMAVNVLAPGLFVLGVADNGI